MTGRVAGAGAVAAAGVAGCAFGPVFGLPALALPLLAVLVPVLVVDLVCSPRFPALRFPLAVVAGGAAGAAVLAVPGGAGPVLDGLRDGWLRTLESTLPARPDPELLAFVPALVLLAAVLGLEWLRRGLPPLLALAPSAAVLVVAQFYRATSGLDAVATACGFGAAAALVLASGRAAARRRAEALVLAGVLVLVAVAAAGALAATDPLRRAPVTAARTAAEVPAAATNPLDDLGGRLARPDEIVFTAAADAPVDRWPVLALDGYDGSGFTSSARYRPLGARLAPDPAVTAPTRVHSADVETAAALGGPWLPTQFRTAAVDGITPAVDPVTGAIVSTDPVTGYGLRWTAPVADGLAGAVLDADAPSLVVEGVPAALAETAASVLDGAAPSFPAALALERWFRDTFTVATGPDVPTGHSAAQLLHFLDGSRRGTSEQFAATYVLMARSAGIPVRLVVGYRQPAERDERGRAVVRNRDAFAWPEVAVSGVGWVPLDPTGEATEGAAGDSVASATQAAREELTGPLPQPAPAPAPEPPPAAERPAGAAPPVLPPPAVALVAVVLLSVGALVGVPLVKALRRAGRRRGEPAAAVAGAWRETRDRLVDHGVPVRAGMTVRDLGRAAAELVPSATVERLARSVDSALYGPRPPDRALADEAWAATGAVDRALAERPRRARLRAALRIGTLVGRSG